jgi:hypothetical protein
VERNAVEENTGEEREAPESSLAGVISCLIGMLLGVGGVILALLGGSPGISSGVAGIGLGLLGYFLGARRLALVTVFVCVAALFFGLVASQGLIPGLGPFDHR